MFKVLQIHNGLAFDNANISYKACSGEKQPKIIKNGYKWHPEKTKTAFFVNSPLPIARNDLNGHIRLV